MRIRVPIVTLLLASTVIAAACAGGAAEDGPAVPGASDVAAAPAPAPGSLNATRVKAAFFEDDLANIDLVQVMGWDEATHTGVFLTVPASMVAQTGVYPVSSTDVGVTIRYGVSSEGEDWDKDWFFTHYTATLVVVTAGTAVGDRVGVIVSNGVFVFEDEEGDMNPAVSATLTNTNVMSGEMDDDPINDC